MNVRMPDGKIIQNVPDGMSQADLVALLNKNGYHYAVPSAAAYAGGYDSAKLALPEAALAVGSNMLLMPIAGWAGIGNEITNWAGITHHDPAETVRRVESLAYQPKTAGGKALADLAALPSRAMAWAGNKAAEETLKYTHSPLAATAVDTAVQGAPFLLGGIKGSAEKAYTESAAEAAERKSAMAPYDETVKAARQEGLKIPPAMVRRDSVGGELSGIPGKIKMDKTASVANQRIVTDMTKRELGIPQHVAITPELLNDLAKQQYDHYLSVIQHDYGKAETSTPAQFSTDWETIPTKGKRALGIVSDEEFRTGIQNLGEEYRRLSAEFPTAMRNPGIVKAIQDFNREEYTPYGAVHIIKELRNQATANLKDDTNYAKMAVGRVQYGIAQQMEGLLERNLARSGDEKLLSDMRDARIKLAKIHAVEKALNPATGDISAARLAALQRRGVPLTGRLKVAADFANAFPGANIPITRVGGSTAWSPFDAMYAIGSIGSGHYGMAAAELAARGILPHPLLSEPYQNAFIENTYGPSFAASVARFASRHAEAYAAILSQEGTNAQKH